MTYQKLAQRLDDCLDIASREKRKHQDQLKRFLVQFRAEEQDLREALKKEKDQARRKNLKKDLRVVKMAYESLGYQPSA